MNDGIFVFHLEYYLVGYYLVSFKFHWSDKMSGANRREPNTGYTNSNVKNKDVLRCKYNFAEIIIGKSQKMIINGLVFFAPAEQLYFFLPFLRIMMVG